MARRRRNRESELPELIIKLVFLGLLLLSLAIGGIGGFTKVFNALLHLGLILIISVVVLSAAGIGAYFLIKHRRGRLEQFEAIPLRPEPSAHNVSPAFRSPVPTPQVPAWSPTRIATAIGNVDWYQFEKICAALLRREGWSVERKGGAQPDGGVDLIATKDGVPMLVQCKHWKTWIVQEKVVRELLGSMTHFKVTRGALYTIKGATAPAELFATQHEMVIVDGKQLAARARAVFSDTELSAFLDVTEHHCPKCESRMVWRTGDFTPFWGCSTYPRCRGILKHSGAK